MELEKGARNPSKAIQKTMSEFDEKKGRPGELNPPAAGGAGGSKGEGAGLFILTTIN